MKLGQIRWEGRVTAAVFEQEHARPVPGYTMRQMVEECEKRHQTLHEFAKDHASKGHVVADAVIPVDPREIWACGCSYEMSASFRDAEHDTREGFYHRAFTSVRPEIFYKGSARTATGPGGAIGIRADSKFTAPEPELAVLLGHKGQVLGYTLANDVSAWDIERENPLYLPQSKIFTGCCALGPWFVTVDELPNPGNIEISCTIRRRGEVLFEGSTSTAKMNRKIEDLIGFLNYANPVPGPSILLTGTGIIVTEAAALAPGDHVSITSPVIGTLDNQAVLVR
jgi:2-dehydro-3-deoxy-D-arabinonate dehydratase